MRSALEQAFLVRAAGMASKPVSNGAALPMVEGPAKASLPKPCGESGALVKAEAAESHTPRRRRGWLTIGDFALTSFAWDFLTGLDDVESDVVFDVDVNVEHKFTLFCRITSQNIHHGDSGAHLHDNFTTQRTRFMHM